MWPETGAAGKPYPAGQLKIEIFVREGF